MAAFLSLIDKLCLQPAAAHPRWAALLAGLILPLALPPLFILPVFYLSFCMVFWLAYKRFDATEKPTISELAMIGWCFGFGQFFTGLLWIGEAFLVEAELFLWALPFAVTGLPAGLALFHAVAFGVWAAFMQRFRARRLPALVLLACFLAVGEFARGHILTGLPWNLPVMGWAGWLYLAQPAALIGPYGLSLIALVSAALCVADKPSLRCVSLAAGLALPILALAYSATVLHGPSRPAPADLKLAIVQPNLTQTEKWRPELRQAHIDKTMDLTALALQLAPDTQLVVWPETAIPALIDEGDGFADLLRARLPQNTSNFPPPYILTGAIRRAATVDGYAYYNSAQIWSGRGLLLAKSDKHHLVPFGEYLPLQGLLEAIGLQQLTRLRGGYRAGPAQPSLTAARLPLLAPLICYEAVFPHLARYRGETRPAALFNLTNDGWFGTSFGPYQHLAQARMRAIEQGLPMIRAANTGISAAFDGRGRLIDRLGLAEKGVLTLALPAALPPTLYHYIGEVGFWILWLSGLVFVWASHRRRR